MLRLDSVTSVLQAVLAGAITTTQPQATVCFSDDVATAATYTGGKQVTVLNSTTDVTICAAPAAATVRDIDFVSVVNRDTASITLTVKFDISGADSTIIRVTLLTLEQLYYTHSDGWKVIAADGSIKTSSSGGSSSPTGPAGGDLTGTYPNPTIANGAIALDELSDVVITTPATGALLLYDGTNWIDAALSGDVTVNASGVATIPAGSISLDELSDVVITAPATGATLIFDGVNWIDGALNLADTDAVTGTLPVLTGGTGVTTLSALSTALALTQRASGRLTLSSATPVMVSDVSNSTSIFYTPYVGDRIALYDGTNWVNTVFTELTNTTTNNTKNPAAVANNSNYDLFVWDDAGTIRLGRGPAWTSDTARGTGAGTTELERVNGILVNKIAITNGAAAQRGRYVGSVRSNGSATIDWKLGTSASGGGAATLGVWNYYNRVSIRATVRDSTVSWTYSSATVRAANNSNGNRINFISGLAEDSGYASYTDQIQTAATVSSFGVFGWAIDSTTTKERSSFAQTPAIVSNNIISSAWGTVVPNIGFHFVQAVENGDGSTTVTFFGNSTTYDLEMGLLM